MTTSLQAVPASLHSLGSQSVTAGASPSTQVVKTPSSQEVLVSTHLSVATTLQPVPSALHSLGSQSVTAGSLPSSHTVKTPSVQEVLVSVHFSVTTSLQAVPASLHSPDAQSVLTGSLSCSHVTNTPSIHVVELMRHLPSAGSTGSSPQANVPSDMPNTTIKSSKRFMIKTSNNKLKTIDHRRKSMNRKSALQIHDKKSRISPE